jgi:hypothetical protein
MTRGLRRRVGIVFALAFALGRPLPAAAYSVLTHEQIVDLAWTDDIVPLLRRRFPRARDQEMRDAHAYAYGGSVLQDMGYYPFGSRFFSDLLHYVRSGDFVEALVDEAQTLDEHAFALGALAHYVSDRTGHPSINRAVALSFPKLRARYGDVVTYAEDPKAHLRTEFGFDVVQVAKGRYTSDSYHDFIGFQVARPVLARAFEKTYDLALEDVLGDVDAAIGSLRRGASQVIPELTRIAVMSERLKAVPDTPNAATQKLLYTLSRADYEKEWGTTYRRPGFLGRVLAVVLRIIPKVGPFRALKVKVPNAETEDLYVKSVNATVDKYRALVRDSGRGPLRLANIDCDTGEDARAGEYALADAAFARLLDRLAERGLERTSPPLRAAVAAFYGDGRVPGGAEKSARRNRRTEAQVRALRAVPAR